ncbi:MAG TPA: glutaredoxin domain-containing protein [Chloroflexota bacterium]|nr:glutaredoxin domain-containing protein [Chloroflexota bacterium]
MEEFLSQRGVSYTTRDVAADEDAMGDLEKLGYMTTPVTVIDGEVVVGFDRTKLDALLAG